MFDLRLLFVALVWGMNFAVVKFSLNDFHPLSFTVIRFFAAALFLFVVMALRGASFTIEQRDRQALVRLGFIGITVYNIFFMTGLKYTTASHSALLISLSPIVAAVIQSIAGKERLSARALTGLGLSSSGVFLIIRSHGSLDFSSKLVLGDMLTLCGTVAWAHYTVLARPLLERYQPVAVTAYSMAAGSILLLPVAASALCGQSWTGISIASWSGLAFSALIAAGIAFSFWYDGVRRIGVTRTAVYHYLTPFSGVIFAAVFLNERIALIQIVGGGCILSGVALVQKGRSV